MPTHPTSSDSNTVTDDRQRPRTRQLTRLQLRPNVVTNIYPFSSHYLLDLIKKKSIEVSGSSLGYMIIVIKIIIELEERSFCWLVLSVNRIFS